MPVDWSRLLDDEKKTLEGESVDCPCPHPLNSSGAALVTFYVVMAVRLFLRMPRPNFDYENTC